MCSRRIQFGSMTTRCLGLAPRLTSSTSFVLACSARGTRGAKDTPLFTVVESHKLEAANYGQTLSIPSADTTNYQISNYRGWQTLWRVARVASEEMNWVAPTSGEAVKKTSSWISATLAFENLSIRNSSMDSLYATTMSGRVLVYVPSLFNPASQDQCGATFVLSASPSLSPCKVY